MPHSCLADKSWFWNNMLLSNANIYNYFKLTGIHVYLLTTGKKDNSSLSSITQRIEEEDIPYILKGKVEKKFFDQKKKILIDISFNFLLYICTIKFKVTF